MTGVGPLVHLPPAADWDAYACANYSSIEWCRRELNLRNDQLLVGSAICSRQTGLLAPDTPRTTTVRPPPPLSQLERNSSRSREACSREHSEDWAIIQLSRTGVRQRTFSPSAS